MRIDVIIPFGEDVIKEKVHFIHLFIADLHSGVVLFRHSDSPYRKS